MPPNLHLNMQVCISTSLSPQTVRKTCSNNLILYKSKIKYGGKKMTLNHLDTQLQWKWKKDRKKNERQVKEKEKEKKERKREQTNERPKKTRRLAAEGGCPCLWVLSLKTATRWTVCRNFKAGFIILPPETKGHRRTETGNMARRHIYTQLLHRCDLVYK